MNKYGWHFRPVSGNLTHHGGRAVVGQRVQALDTPLLGQAKKVRRAVICGPGLHALPVPDPSFICYGRLLTFCLLEKVVMSKRSSAGKFAGVYRTILWEKTIPDEADNWSSTRIEAWAKAQGFSRAACRAKAQRLGLVPKRAPRAGK